MSSLFELALNRVSAKNSDVAQKIIEDGINKKFPDLIEQYRDRELATKPFQNTNFLIGIINYCRCEEDYLNKLIDKDIIDFTYTNIPFGRKHFRVLSYGNYYLGLIDHNKFTEYEIYIRRKK